MFTQSSFNFDKHVKGGLLTQSSKTEKLFESLNVRQDRFTNSN
jgi:hypothetical protein